MKRILTVILILISFKGVSQVTPIEYPTPYTTIGSGQNSAGKVKGGLFIDSVLRPPRYPDTIKANNSRTSLYGGSKITVNDVEYFRSEDNTRWIASGTSGCPGTQLISGSATWSGTNLEYDVTDLQYYILCSFYSANGTMITLNAANPSFGRFDIIYADNTSSINVITGTPSANPQVPTDQLNPLTQINLTIVFIPAGSTVPGGEVMTTIYDEVVGSWSGTSDVTGINFAYATNPYSGVVSTYVPNADDGENVTWTNGSDLDINDYQYLKFYVRLNAVLPSDPEAFLRLSFYNGATQISQEFLVPNGAYGFDGNTINAYQLIVIPLSSIIISDNDFDKLYIEIAGAPSSFQLDKVYLLSGSVTPPVISNAWQLQGNASTNEATDYIGTSDAKRLNFGTNGQIRGWIDTSGITSSPDTSYKMLLQDSVTGKIWRYNIPKIFRGSGIAFTDSAGGTVISTSGGGSTYTASNGLVIQGVDIKVQDTLPVGTGNKFQLFSAKQGAFRANSASGAGQTYNNIDSIGNGSAAFGRNTRATAIYSLAYGSGSRAAGQYSFAGGLNSTVLGTAGVAIGQSAFAGSSGYNAVFGFNSFGNTNALVVGNTDTAYAGGLVVGESNVSNNGGLIVGGYNTTSGGLGTALGDSNIVRAASSATIGHFLIANNAFNTSVGQFNDTIVVGSSTAFNTANRIFQEGIGTANNNRKDGLNVYGSGSLRLNQYGSGTFTGTPTYGLAVDASGNVIEVSSTPSGTPNTVAFRNIAGELTGSDSLVVDQAAGKLKSLYGVEIGEADTDYGNLRINATEASGALLVYNNNTTSVDFRVNTDDKHVTIGEGLANYKLGLNTGSPSASSVLDAVSTTKGILIPRMTEAERDAISSPATSLMIFQTDGTSGFYYYNGAAWAAIGGASTLTQVLTANNTANDLDLILTGTGTLTATKVIAPNVINSFSTKTDEDFSALPGYVYKYSIGSPGAGFTVTFPGSGLGGEIIAIRVLGLSGETLTVSGDVRDETDAAMTALAQNTTYQFVWNDGDAQWVLLSKTP